MFFISESHRQIACVSGDLLTKVFVFFWLEYALDLVDCFIARF